MKHDQLRDCAKRFGTPLLVGSRMAVYQQIQRLRQALPSVSLFYAVKANPDAELIKILAGQQIGFDVASFEELRHVTACLATNDPSTNQEASFPILHSNPCKRPGDIAQSYQAGLRRFVFDQAAEIDKLAQLAPEACCFLRLSIPHGSSVVDLSQRFGATEVEALTLAAEARRQGLLVDGLAFHVGSQATSPVDFETGIAISRRVWNELTKRQHALRFLDIGGGFPVPYRDCDELSLPDYFHSIQLSLQHHFGDVKVTVLAEPGRFLSAEAIGLMASVIGKQRRQGVPWYTIDDGRYGSFSGRYFHKRSFDFYPITDADTNNDASSSLEPSMIAGPTCDGGDIVAEAYPLPELKVGDLLWIPRIGAYGAASACHFNGIAPAHCIWLD